MTRIFLHVFNASIPASYLIFAVLVLRFFTKKAPRWISVLLWGIVSLRLLCPVFAESSLSLIPSAETVSPGIMTDPTPSVQTGIPLLNDRLNPILEENFAPLPGDSANPLQILLPAVAFLWLLGVGALLLYAFCSWAILRKKLSTAISCGNHVYQSERIKVPFVLGILRPKIYLPFSLNKKEIRHVLSHENAHIRRGDPLWKALGFLALALHWFNPLVWVSFVLFCRDVEFSCDEKVIRGLTRDERAEYSRALLFCSTERSRPLTYPLCFGEVSVRERIRSVLKYRKPTTIAASIGLILCVVIGFFFLTNPKAAPLPDHPSFDKESPSTGDQTAGDIHPPQTEESPWIFEPTVIFFDESSFEKCSHVFYTSSIETFPNDDPTSPYRYCHSYSKPCVLCGETVKSVGVYVCRYNNSDCRGGCTDGRLKEGYNYQIEREKYREAMRKKYPDRLFWMF